MMQDDEQVLVSCRRFDRETTGQIGGRPLGPVEGEGVAVEGGVKGIGRDGSKLRDEGSVLWSSLCAFVFSGLSVWRKKINILSNIRNVHSKCHIFDYILYLHFKLLKMYMYGIHFSTTF